MANFLKSIAKNLFNKIIKKNDDKMLSVVSKVLKGTNITLVDIGAAGGIESRWKKISPLLHYIGFEPDERSNADLTQSGFAKSEIYKNPVWDRQTTLSINLASKPQVSSYYTPNKNFVDLFPDSSRFTIETVEKFQSVTLDALDLKSCDFIKLDIQGGELNVLQGAQKTLQKSIGLEVEVHFLNVYHNQPLFGTVVDFLRLHDYYFIDFINLTRWERNAHSGFGQCVFGDALFLKMPENVVTFNNGEYELISKYLAICFLYNRFDLIDVIINLIGKEQNQNITEFLSAIKPIRSNHNTIRRINAMATQIMKLVAGGDYKSHVVY